jgi:hypothetical protein
MIKYSAIMCGSVVDECLHYSGVIWLYVRTTVAHMYADNRVARIYLGPMKL